MAKYLLCAALLACQNAEVPPAQPASASPPSGVRDEMKEWRLLALRTGYQLRATTPEEARAYHCEFMEILDSATNSQRTIQAKAKARHELYGCLIPPLPSTGYWDVSTEISKMDGQETTIIAVDELSGEGALFLRCTDGRVEVFVKRKVAFFAQNVLLKFDDEKPAKWWAKEASDSMALFLVKPNEVIKKMRASARLILRASPVQRTPIDIEFEVTGLQAAIARGGPKCRAAFNR